MSRLFKRFAFAAALAGSLAVSGCVTAVVGAGGAVGMGAAEERGLEGAIDDTKIRAQINDLWFQRDFQMFNAVTLNINEGRVMLTGTVEKPETRVEAVRLAWQAAGVRQVLDEIQVTDQSGFTDYASDVWIANKLRTRLMFDSKIDSINYTIDVVNGVVYVMGIAQSQDEVDRVIAHARDISNVRRVINHVLLKDDPKRHQV